MTRFPTIASLTGEVLPARDGQRVEIQARRGGTWRTVLTAPVRSGAYRASITQPGVYRAAFHGAAGPAVHVGR